MRRPLSSYELSALRRLAAQLHEQDPELARQLERPGIPLLARLSPLHWSNPLYLVIGIAFLATGLLLDVGSAVLGGLFLLICGDASLTVRARRRPDGHGYSRGPVQAPSRLKPHDTGSAHVSELRTVSTSGCPAPAPAPDGQALGVEISRAREVPNPSL